MVQVKVLDRIESFETRAQASRFVRDCIVSRINAQIITQEVTPQGKFGGYNMIASLRPVHAL